MAQIFVSHSKNDTNLDFFHRGFSTTGIKGVFMEYEEMEMPAWIPIKDNVMDADSVFVLLSKAVKDKEYTQNWIAFEVGLACYAGKNVWVFERLDEQIDFVVPYLTHYVLYYPSNDDNFKFVREVIQKRGVEGTWGYSLNCVHCGIAYNLCTRVEEWICPCCRKELKLAKHPWVDNKDNKGGEPKWWEEISQKFRE